MIGTRVSAWNSSRGMATGSSVPFELGIASGSSPSGNTNPLPVSMLTTARTLRLRNWVSHPNPPA
jgi:hypothetical protein